MDILGIDIGGSSLKAATVNCDQGILTSERLVIPTPRPATPEAVAERVRDVVDAYAWSGPIGCGLPVVVRNGVACTAANIDKSWIDTDVRSLFMAQTGLPVQVCNDADAAGLAEMKFGAGKTATGTTLVITVGTGLGSALFHDQTLVPNTELGHLQLDGQDAESITSARVRTERQLSFQDWAKRFDNYLHQLETLFWPELFIIGGEISRDHAAFFPYLTIRTRILPAALRNNAGIIGAAMAAAG